LYDIEGLIGSERGEERRGGDKFKKLNLCGAKISLHVFIQTVEDDRESPMSTLGIPGYNL
jgi:hypothetical protein